MKGNNRDGYINNKTEDEVEVLALKIREVWKIYEKMQKDYKRLTGRRHEWLK